MLVATNANAEDAQILRFPNTPIIQATGHASQSVLPDEFTIRATIETSGPTPEAAFAALAPKVEKLLGSVRQAGIDDIETRAIGPDSQALFRHVYDNSGREIYEKREATGYRASYTLIIKSKKMDKPGNLIPAMTGAGADIDSVYFDVSNREDLRRKLELTAVNDAATRAREMIAAAGAKPGRILEIDPPHDDGVADLNKPTKKGVVDFSFALRPGRIELKETHVITMEILPN